MIRTPPIHTRRLAVNDSYTFLMKELEKVDDAILEPLSAHTPSAPTHRRVLPTIAPLVFSHIKKVSGFIYVIY